MNTVATEPLNLGIQNDADPRRESRELEELRKIEENIAYMLQHLDTPLQVSTLAAQMNCSPSHYFTLFKRHVGSSPINYFIRLRLQYACHLLERTKMSVKAVACTLGYDDPLYFSRIFKSYNRLTPSQYRLECADRGHKRNRLLLAGEDRVGRADVWWSSGGALEPASADQRREVRRADKPVWF